MHKARKGILLAFVILVFLVAKDTVYQGRVLVIVYFQTGGKVKH